ncbi:hypothetical protein J3R30DRAFT_3653678 [Lentinula aciculospora]|uniref:AB hydrolase-1 domain-containing protein n=1 Tax=Lentinula aciculospora TaxID=153920 RepID=A0A9W9DYT1_9AGAR|nr:hypothetical protein J3R30DRAFT_3653678 [Lentinula aciculospora]
MSQQLVHLVYIHGFRGDETTFQAFPTHLQQYVTEHIPSHLNLRVQSSLYPTYKSVKPISSATKNFIEWLRTQPPGPVILLAHSMGGLLAAEAATDPSSANDGRRRIVGLIAFDCPYLGMHPHVVITGLASLVPKKNESKMKTEAELNPDPEVRIVDRTKETENWNEKQNVYSSAPSPSNSSTLSSAASHSESDHFVGRAMKLISSHSDDALVRWARKHSNEPFSAGKRWVVEHFQFGSCMFDPSGLKDRYTNLEADSQQMLDDNDEALIGTGVANPPENPSNTVAHIGLTASHLLPLSLDNTPETPVIPGPKTKSEVKAHAKATEKEIRAQQKERKKEEKHLEKKQKAAQKERHTHAKAATKARTEEKAGRHFVVLPTGLGAILGGGDHWERVVIGGVDDEVAAHCGLFIPEQNLEYTKLVERVGLRIMEWCDKV